jgi:hypothetical protein
VLSNATMRVEEGIVWVVADDSMSESEDEDELGGLLSLDETLWRRSRRRRGSSEVMMVSLSRRRDSRDLIYMCNTSNIGFNVAEEGLGYIPACPSWITTSRRLHFTQLYLFRTLHG